MSIQSKISIGFFLFLLTLSTAQESSATMMDYEHSLKAMVENKLGQLYFARNDYADSAKWYRKAAGWGNSEAQYNLGLMYESGNGVTQDFARAFRWMRMSAMQGNPAAEVKLGDIYLKGRGTTKDLDKAKIWYQKASDKGSKEAREHLNEIEKEIEKERAYQLILEYVLEELNVPLQITSGCTDYSCWAYVAPIFVTTQEMLQGLRPSDFTREEIPGGAVYRSDHEENYEGWTFGRPLHIKIKSTERKGLWRVTTLIGIHADGQSNAHRVSLLIDTETGDVQIESAQ